MSHVAYATLCTRSFLGLDATIIYAHLLDNDHTGGFRHGGVLANARAGRVIYVGRLFELPARGSPVEPFATVTAHPGSRSDHVERARRLLESARVDRSVFIRRANRKIVRAHV